jgi:uncharacterized protein
MLLVLLLITDSRAEAREVPPLKGRVNDQAELLSPAMRSQLERRLEAYEQSTGHQFAVLTVRSLEGDPLEDFSIRVVETWQLGRSKADDGLLLLIAADDRKMRIEVGYGLEGAITDLLSARIIRQVLTPAFQRDDFDTGVAQAMDLLMRAAQGEAVRVPGRGASGETLPPWLPLILLASMLLLPTFFGASGRRRRGYGVGAGMGMGMGGFGHRGGFGGGGGFSGGGGGFGGGGASGGW